MIAHWQRHGSIGYMNQFPDVRTPGFDMDAYNCRFHDANLIIDGRTKKMSYDPHWGPLSIKFTKGGSEFYKSGDAMFRVDDDCFLIFNEGKYYESWIDEEREVESYTLNMTPTFEREALSALKCSRTGIIDLPGPLDRIRFTERTYTSSPRVTFLVNDIRTLAKELGDTHVRIQELFFAVFMEMIALQETSDREALATGKIRPASRDELYRRLLIAKEFLHACFQQEVTLHMLANVACLNPYYLLREFRKVFRCTPHQYLTQLRLTAAKRMLVQNHSSVDDVCFNVGFLDSTSFAKLFRRHTGLTPTEFRRMSEL